MSDQAWGNLTPEEKWQQNHAVIMHELTTPILDHDPDGACCRAAIADLPQAGV